MVTDMERFSIQLKYFTSIFLNWFLEVAAFILLPLLIYVLAYSVLEADKAEVFRLPEWMFISVILFGEAIKRLIVFYRNSKDMEQKILKLFPIGFIGITISAILLCFSMIASMRPPVLTLKPLFYRCQYVIFAASVIFSAAIKIWLDVTRGGVSEHVFERADLVNAQLAQADSKNGNLKSAPSPANYLGADAREVEEQL